MCWSLDWGQDSGLSMAGVPVPCVLGRPRYFALPLSRSTIRSFLSCLSPLFQNESSCKTFHMENEFLLTSLFSCKSNSLHMKSFAFVLKQRQQITPPIGYRYLQIVEETWQKLWDFICDGLASHPAGGVE